MKICILILSIFLMGSCSLKEQALIDTNLKSQTLMFTQKYKITQDKLNAIVSMSYLNPVLDNASKDDIFALTFTPNTLEIHNLEVFINNKKAHIAVLDNAYLKYLIQNNYTYYFKVSLPGVKEKNKLLARICLNHLPCFELNFQKYPKSLYYRSEDIDIQYN
ncbi:hypothetical protein LNU06_02690 [Campylobacter sp. VicNov18]|uniref:hypothetical protein n=1 Tax=Campylobacter bilis TaxID=2691918 RepID=UPI00130E0509|nr:hypothetical protein [Campylobacter bilis]MPV63552.1 hypothetical protein [Campylobacter hepaticus]MBM0637052.1 hypothetical protein [Campylobacter bilis]MCC8277790.1 hypothetical protein [Campylobacter bilis]MCC8299399.1 hypothetical protein [Campylobacter bilis]MCC8300699.1 hypothetical protein [Campylobacter bilis]